MGGSLAGRSRARSFSLGKSSASLEFLETDLEMTGPAAERETHIRADLASKADQVRSLSPCQHGKARAVWAKRWYVRSEWYMHQKCFYVTLLINTGSSFHTHPSTVSQYRDRGCITRTQCLAMTLDCVPSTRHHSARLCARPSSEYVLVVWEYVATGKSTSL